MLFWKNEVWADDESIEHILPECGDGNVTNIGNLIMLEGTLNHDADQHTYEEKVGAYRKSNYMWVKNFIANHNEWREAMIKDRAKELASLYYDKILDFPKYY